MLEKIDHLGIAVNSIEEARQFYENVLGLHCEKTEEIASQKVRTAFFRIGEIHIELLEPTSKDSPIAKFLESRGEGIHHVSYKSSDISAELEKAAAADCRLIHNKPITGAGGKQVAFLHPRSTHGVLTEFCSDPE